MSAQAQTKQAVSQDAYSRVFPTACGSELGFSVQVRIGEEDDGRNWQSCRINNETGLIDIPSEHLWGSVESVGQAMRRKDQKVMALRATVRFAQTPGRLVLVTQRPGNQDYKVMRYEMSRTESHCVCRLPATDVRFSKRNASLQAAEGRGPLVVRTANNRDSGFGTNRTDIWIVNENGMMQLVQLIIITDDDGKSFRLVAINRWAGQVHRLPASSPYQALMYENVYELPEVRELADQVTFVPTDSHPGFDVRAQVLELPTLRNFLLSNLENFPSGAEKKRNYPVRRNVSFGMTGGGGIVAFYAPDMGTGGWGLVEQPQENADPIKFQIRRACIAEYGIIEGQESTLLTDDGILDIQMGDIVTWTETMDMGPDHPPLILDAKIAYAS
ncbi:hypothetical protein KKD95_03835 [Patescibacteria group bacterium]|nr:hypothetical protein [Patescibacteria group bacterium]